MDQTRPHIFSVSGSAPCTAWSTLRECRGQKLRREAPILPSFLLLPRYIGQDMKGRRNQTTVHPWRSIKAAGANRLTLYGLQAIKQKGKETGSGAGESGQQAKPMRPIELGGRCFRTPYQGMTCKPSPKRRPANCHATILPLYRTLPRSRLSHFPWYENVRGR